MFPIISRPEPTLLFPIKIKKIAPAIAKNKPTPFIKVIFVLSTIAATITTNTGGVVEIIDTSIIELYCMARLKKIKHGDRKSVVEGKGRPG